MAMGRSINGAGLHAPPRGPSLIRREQVGPKAGHPHPWRTLRWNYATPSLTLLIGRRSRAFICGSEGAPVTPVEDARHVDVVGPVGIYRLEVARAEMGDGLLADFMALGCVGVDGVLQVPGGGQHASVGDQRQAVGLHRLVLVAAVSLLSRVGEGDEAAEIL